MVIVPYPFGSKRTGEAVRNEIIKNKQRLEENGETFPFNRILSVQTIIDWINNFEWESNRLNKYYDKAITIDDTVNEFNILQVERKTKRINILNNALDALLNINVKLSMKLATINPQNEDGTVNTSYKELTKILTSIAYMYNTLERLHGGQTIEINTFKGFVADWRDIKDRLQPHHNPFVTKEDHIQANIDTIDYFYENYVTE